MLIVGSLALQDAMSKMGYSPPRVAKDLDVICYAEELAGFEHLNLLKKSDKFNKRIYKDDFGLKIEVEVARWNSHQEELLTLVGNEQDVQDYASLDVLYTLKMSHRYLKNSPHFLKTMRDIQLMRRLGAKIPDFLKEWLAVREYVTYDYPHPKLNQSKQDFFDTTIFKENPYIYDHDSLHEAVKLYDKPAYSYFTNGQVKVCREMFEHLPEDIKLASVYEEACVLALERSVIPHGTSSQWAFLKALEKVCTSISSGWWREFAWENYDVVVELYSANIDFLSKFEKALKAGIVKPFKQ